MNFLVRVFSISAILISLNSFGAEGIKFKHDLSLEEMMTWAKEESKPIFIDAYAVWCGPCKYMSANVFTDPEVAEFFNENFVNVKLDMETALGEQFNEAFPVEAYPTMMVISPEGELMREQVGALDSEGLIDFGTIALDPSKDPIIELHAQFEGGNRSPEFLVEYVQVLAENEIEYEHVVEAYWNHKLSWENSDDVEMFYFQNSRLSDENVKLWILEPQIVWEALGENAYYTKYKEVVFNQLENLPGNEMEEELAEIDSFTDKVLAVDDEIETEDFKEQIRAVYQDLF